MNPAANVASATSNDSYGKRYAYTYQRVLQWSQGQLSDEPVAYIRKYLLGYCIRIFPMTDQVSTERWLSCARKRRDMMTDRPPWPKFSLICVNTTYLLQHKTRQFRVQGGLTNQ